MSKIGFTFNWFYADDRDIAYFNSGNNPVRARGTDPEFPMWGTGQFDWRGWNPGLNIAQYTGFGSHPQTINQPYITSWNNKQALGVRAAEDNYSYGSVHRSLPLDERIAPRISGAGKMTLAQLIDAMEDAGTVDLRGSHVLPWILRVIARGKGGVPADLGDELATLNGWVASGAHRRDRNQDGVYEDARAVQLMDAWWPRLLEGIFLPRLGNPLFTAVKRQLPFDDPPGPIGSAYINGWFSYVHKDLRKLLGRKVKGPLSRGYCGTGKKQKKRMKRCKAILLDTLRAASTVPRSTLYPAGDDCATGDDQVCHDTVRFRTTGGVGVDEIHWINRPTFQQVVEAVGHRGRGVEIAAKRCKKKGNGKKSAGEAAKANPCKPKKKAKKKR